MDIPSEWGTLIPTAMIINVVEKTGNREYLRPVLNPEWLSGLEKAIRQIVREELAKKV